MMIPSHGLRCQSEDLAEYRRVCGIAAEYTRLHPSITVAVGMTREGSHFVSLAVMGERQERVEFEAPRGVSRDELFGQFGEAAGIASGPSADDEWDW
jgi:hypothetical protein